MAVLAYHIHEGTYDFPAALIIEAVGITPGIARHRRVRLPRIWLCLRKTAAFHLHDPTSEHHGIMLVADHDILSPAFTTIIIERCQLFQVRMKRLVLNPPVEIQKLRSILHNQLHRARQPVIQKFLTREGFAEKILRVRFRHCRPVKIPFFQWFMDITVKRFSISHRCQIPFHVP